MSFRDTSIKALDFYPTLIYFISSYIVLKTVIVFAFQFIISMLLLHCKSTCCILKSHHINILSWFFFLAGARVFPQGWLSIFISDQPRTWNKI